jgi:hypothetical protein
MLSLASTLRWREFRLPKRGHRADECEDYCLAAPQFGRFAVADGATESSQSGEWARLLVEAFVQRSGGPVEWNDWLPPLQSRWSSESARRLGSEPLPWFVEAQLEQGAFSTFLGLVIEPSGWYAQAVGDTCLFQVRHDTLFDSFPLRRSADFGSTPWLIGSRGPVAVPQREGQARRGTWQVGDGFWLMTDALAEWFLRLAERGANPWRTLQDLEAQGEEAFSRWVDGQRGSGQLRNDDVTLLTVRL